MDKITTYILLCAYSNGIINVSPRAGSTKNNWIWMVGRYKLDLYDMTQLVILYSWPPSGGSAVYSILLL